MKVRAITIGVSLTADDLQQDLAGVRQKFSACKSHLQAVEEQLTQAGYGVQTIRIACNSWEDWLIPFINQLVQDGNASSSRDDLIQSIMRQLDEVLDGLQIAFCSIGPCHTPTYYSDILSIFAGSVKVSTSIAFSSHSHTLSSPLITPNHEDCIAAANITLTLARIHGDLANFRFCVASDCPAGTPFFPIAYHATGQPSSISLGFENGDLLFLAFFHVKNHQEATNQLSKVLVQAYTPIQDIVKKYCQGHDLYYQGIDASMNPGLTLPVDSIGQNLELIIPEPRNYFGASSTLAAVSTITSAVKSIASQGIQLAGYSGLMLPVMEDIILALRAQENRYSIRDLLFFSSVCGVGIDTVPIPGDSDSSDLAALYMDVSAMAFRLKKPLSCRVLPMKDKQVGEMTNVDSPYLCNTTVFSIAL